MDLVYLSDAMSYHSARGAMFAKYDCRPSYEDKMTPLQLQNQKMQQQQMEEKRKKGACRLCKENQKRKLSLYIRSKCPNSVQRQSVKEEDEEEEKASCSGNH